MRRREGRCRRASASRAMPASSRVAGHCWTSSLPISIGLRQRGAGNPGQPAEPGGTERAALSPREALRSTNPSSASERCSPPSAELQPGWRARARMSHASSLLATRTPAHILRARCFWLSRFWLRSWLAIWAAVFGLGTACAWAGAGSGWRPAFCWAGGRAAARRWLGWPAACWYMLEVLLKKLPPAVGNANCEGHDVV